MLKKNPVKLAPPRRCRSRGSFRVKGVRIEGGRRGLAPSASFVPGSPGTRRSSGGCTAPTCWRSGRIMWLGRATILAPLLGLLPSRHLASELLPGQRRPASHRRVWARARFLVNYVNKNLYQQLLFFILPIYAGSTTWSSRNVLFLIVLAVSAVLSTLDVVYDRVLSARRVLAAWFFAFNAFAVVSVALP